jgi:adenylate kinase family enzyme
MEKRKMIINTRTDLDNAPEEVRQKFIERLSYTIHSWQWQNEEWVEKISDNEISRFGFTLSDFPNPPKQPKPTNNPDEEEYERNLQQVLQQRQNAYEKESDPINFMYQRGEATKEEWTNKVLEIKARYPKP